MRIKFTFFFLLFVFQYCNAQIITTVPSEIYLGPINFNKEVISKNKIKSISVSMVDKPDGNIIIDRGATQSFDFNEKGELNRYYYTVLNREVNQVIDFPAVIKRGKIIQPASSKTYKHYINDTIFCSIFYDEKDRVVGKRIKTGDYYDAYYYEYNEKNQIKKELHCKETNLSENKNNFKLGVQSILSSEVFEYENLTKTQIRKKCLNDEGREYKKAIINYDSKGRKISESYDFIVGWMMQERSYTYSDTSNYLFEFKYIGNENGKVNKKSTYKYDEKGNILMEKVFNNDELINEITYLYDENNILVKSHINRDFKNASIGIVKYSYTFY